MAFQEEGRALPSLPVGGAWQEAETKGRQPWWLRSCETQHGARMTLTLSVGTARPCRAL